MKTYFTKYFFFQMAVLIMYAVSSCENNKITSKYTYYPSGKIETKKVFYVPDDTSTYTLYVYYPSGKLRAIVPYKHSKRNGTRVLYYENGNIESIAHFKNDKFWGVVHEYYDDGSDKKKMLIINDYNLLYSSYYYNKENMKKEVWIYPFYDEKGRFHEEIIGGMLYDSNGNIIDSLSKYYKIIPDKDTIYKNEKFCFTIKLYGAPDSTSMLYIYIGHFKNNHLLIDTNHIFKSMEDDYVYHTCIPPEDTGYNVLLGRMRFYHSNLHDTIDMIIFKEYYVKSN